MDASDTRRGRPATHRAFGTEHRTAGWRGDPSSTARPRRSCSATCCSAGPTSCCAAAGCPAAQVSAALDVFDLCRSEVIAGQFLDVSVQARGRADVETAMTVLRYKSAKYSIERPLHVGAALAGAGRDTLAELTRSGCRWARRSSCATTCSACSATRRRPASPPATTWSRASERCWSRSPSTRPRRRTPRCSTARSGTPLDATRWTAAPDHRRLRRARAGRGGDRASWSTRPWPRWTRRTSTSGARPCCASWPPPRPSASSDGLARQSSVGEATTSRSGPSPRSSTANGPPRRR